MAEQNSERKVIKVASLIAPNPKFPTLLEFKGEDGVKYETWVKAFATEIKLGAELDCEITHSEKKTETGVFFHHKVTQIYKDGKPLYESKPQQAQYKGRSAESYAEERRSIERQTSIKSAIEMSLDTDTLETILERAESIAQWISGSKIEARRGEAPFPLEGKVKPGALEQTSTTKVFDLAKIPNLLGKKAIDKIMADQQCSSDVAYAILFKKWLQELELIIPKAAPALCLAIEKLIDGEKCIDAEEYSEHGHLCLEKSKSDSS